MDAQQRANKYAEGYEAQSIGKRFEDCPYPSGSFEFMTWQDGYQESRIDDDDYHWWAGENMEA